MRWLNYHHYLYFWMVVREGGIQPAAKRLRLSHPTVSAQIRQFEESLGQALFDRSKRRLRLTETGRIAYEYADEIFKLGQEFLDVLDQRPTGRPIQLVVGATAAIPKAVVRRLLSPALELDERVRVVCREDEHDRLLGLLAVHEVDVVLSDVPLSPTSGVSAFNHLLGECGATFFASEALKQDLRGRFPRCLDGAPFLAPLSSSSLGRALVQWFEEQDLRPEIVAEVQDSALIKALGRDGVGAFCLPSIVEREVRTNYGGRILGRTAEVRERFFAISPERRVKNPAVAAICETAREKIFAV
jgi:LysR family transcriptional activator of nhaA